jgi:hypothetical protein
LGRLDAFSRWKVSVLVLAALFRKFDLGYFLPPDTDLNMDFIKQLLRGDKEVRP